MNMNLNIFNDLNLIRIFSIRIDSLGQMSYYMRIRRVDLSISHRISLEYIQKQSPVMCEHYTRYPARAIRFLENNLFSCFYSNLLCNLLIPFGFIFTIDFVYNRMLIPHK